MRRFFRSRFTHLMSPLFLMPVGEFEVNFDVISLHPVLIDFRLGSSRSTETALIVCIPDDGCTSDTGAIC